MRSTRTRKASPSVTVMTAGGIVLGSEDVHAVEDTFGGAVAICGAGSVVRTLRAPFDATARGGCDDCRRLVADPAATPSSRAPLML